MQTATATEWPKVDGAITEWVAATLETIDLRLAAHGVASVQARTDLDAQVFLLTGDDELGDSTILQLTVSEARALAAHLLKVADFVETAQR